MKKELAAGGVLLLLIIGSICNIFYLKYFIGGMEDGLDEAMAACEQGDFATAQNVLGAVINQWLDADEYTHILIRHPEIDSTTDAFFDLLSDVRSEDAAAAAGSYGKLRTHLESLYTMEKVTFGSIF